MDLPAAVPLPQDLEAKEQVLLDKLLAGEKKSSSSWPRQNYYDYLHEYLRFYRARLHFLSLEHDCSKLHLMMSLSTGK